MVVGTTSMGIPWEWGLPLPGRYTIFGAHCSPKYGVLLRQYTTVHCENRKIFSYAIGALYSDPLIYYAFFVSDFSAPVTFNTILRNLPLAKR